MTDNELSNLLKEWKRTPAPPALSARVFKPRALPPSSWWDRIPASLTAAAGAVAGGLGVWALIALTIHPQAAPIPQQAKVEQSQPPVTPAVAPEPVAKELPPTPKPPKPVQAKKLAKAPPAENLTTASPRLLNGPVPLYPDDAPLLRSPITLKLRLRIDTKGRVIDAEVIDGDPLLSSIALEAVKAWLYEPGAAATTEVEVVFEPKKKK